MSIQTCYQTSDGQLLYDKNSAAMHQQKLNALQNREGQQDTKFFFDEHGFTICYRTSDGEIYENKHDAERHEQTIDELVKFDYWFDENGFCPLTDCTEEPSKWMLKNLPRILEYFLIK